jgi:hypothetical protein
VKSKDVVGKRVSRLWQERTWNEEMRCWDVVLHAICFEDGSCIKLHTNETVDQPVVTSSYYRTGGMDSRES